MTTSIDFTTIETGQHVIYHEHVRRGPKKEIPAVFVSLSGSESVVIEINQVKKTVKRSSLTAIAEGKITTLNTSKENTKMAKREIKKNEPKTKPAAVVTASDDTNDVVDVMHDRMLAAAEDINSRGYFKPPISLEMEDSALEAELKETSEQLVAEDELDDSTWALFAEWGVGPRVGEAKAEAEEEPAGEPVDVSAPLAAVKKAKTIDDLKAIAKDNGIRIAPPFLKDLTKLRTYVTEKLNDLGAGKAPAKKKVTGAVKTKTKKEDAAPRYTRANAFAEVLNTGETNREAILSKSNEAYIANGGKDNIKEAKWMYGIASSVLVALGLAVETDKTFKLNK